MAEYDPGQSALRYLPQQAPYIPDLSGPMEVHRRHMLDLQAKEQADRVMAQRSQEMAQHQGNNERDAAQHAHEFERSDRRAGQREDLYAKEEERRNNEVVFNHKRLRDQEHEQLLHQLYYGATPAEQAYAADVLRRAGDLPEPMYASDFPTPGAGKAAPVAGEPAPVDEAEPSMPQAKFPGMAEQRAMRPPMGARDAQTARQLDSVPSAPQLPPGAAPGGLPAPRGTGKYFPGSRAIPSQSLADEYGLAPDDPLRKLQDGAPAPSPGRFHRSLADEYGLAADDPLRRQ